MWLKITNPLTHPHPDEWVGRLFHFYPKDFTGLDIYGTIVAVEKRQDDLVLYTSLPNGIMRFGNLVELAEYPDWWLFYRSEEDRFTIGSFELWAG